MSTDKKYNEIWIYYLAPPTEEAPLGFLLFRIVLDMILMQFNTTVRRQVNTLSTQTWSICSKCITSAVQIIWLKEMAYINTDSVMLLS